MNWSVLWPFLYVLQCMTHTPVEQGYPHVWPNCPHSLKCTWLFLLRTSVIYPQIIAPNQTKQQFKCSFTPIVYPCSTLSAAWCFLLLHPPCLSLSFSPYIKRWVALSPHSAIFYVESPPDTLAYLSSASQTSKSVLASQRDGEAPPGSRRRLQSTRCSPGIKYPFR